MRAVVREIAIFLFYLLLASALTWPLAHDLSTAVPNRGDPLFTAWALDWVCHALRTNPLRLFDATIFYPTKYSLALSEHLTGVAIFVMPLHIAGAGAIALNNVAMLFSFALSGYGAFVLARLVTGRTIPALAAGVFYAFVPFKFDHISHLQILAAGWLPLSLGALIAFWRSGRTKHAALFAAAFVMNGLSNTYWLLFAGFALTMTVVFLAVVEPRHDRTFWFRLGVAGVIAALLLLPFLIPYAVVSNDYRMKRTSDESRHFSATPGDWLKASPTSVLYLRLSADSLEERRLFPGVLSVALAVTGVALTRRLKPSPHSIAMWRRLQPAKLWIAAIVFSILGCVLAFAGRVSIGSIRFSGSDVPFTLAVVCLVISIPWREIVSRSRFSPELWVAALWIVIGVVASLGEHAFLHSFLFRVVEPFRATRAPARWAIIAYTGLAVWMAWGIVQIQLRWGRIVAFILLGASVAELIPRLNWVHVERELKPVYHWLARARPRAAIELPIGWNETEFGYLYATTFHRVPIMNGVSGFDPPLHDMLSKHRYDVAMLAVIAQNGVNVIIVHPDARERARPWVENGQLRLLASFPDGDQAYEIADNR